MKTASKTSSFWSGRSFCVPYELEKYLVSEDGKPMSVWIQKEIQLPRFRRGCHPITREVLQALPELAQIRVGLLHIFLRHTSASLTLNENADPDVPVDLEMGLNRVAPENLPYVHTIEGPDDMPAHLKSSILGCSLTIPVSNGRLMLGTWQGIFLFEHRNHAGRRAVVLTLQGEQI